MTTNDTTTTDRDDFDSIIGSGPYDGPYSLMGRDVL